ncbi:hypothetical protein KY329_00940, partial [Candidatus Woesearchaeota archaeon]|nr:hypothetical protein [Candidatus Woesearchaeota archaeon]
KMLFLEQNLLSNHRTAMDQIKSLQQDIVDIKRHIQEIEDRILTIIKELRLTARKEDIDVMRKYLDLWDPVKFVTMETVERMINDKLGIENPPLKPIKAEVIEKVEPEVIVEPEVEIEEPEESGKNSFEELLKKHGKGNV